MQKLKSITLGSLVSLVIPSSLLTAIPAAADYVSPHIEDKGYSYSKEAPDKAFYGSGPAGRMCEASMLRFEGEQDFDEHRTEDAVRKLSKALSLDPGDPTTHLLFARALTAKFYATKGPVNERLLQDCLAEWKLIWRHDADSLEQREARLQAKQLIHIARALQKTREEQAELIANKGESNKKNEVAAKPATKQIDSTPAAKEDAKSQPKDNWDKELSF